MSFLEKLYNGALKLTNVVSEKTAQLEEFKYEFSHLSDRELFEVGKKETVDLKKQAINQLLRERGYEFDYEIGRWRKM